MLQTIREKFTGTFAIAILAIICIPFVFFGINYNFIGAGYAAKVNGEEISTGQLESAYQSELQRYAEFGELPAEFRVRLKANILDNLVRNAVIDQYLADSGYRVTDQMIADLIQRETAFFVDGKFSKEKYYSVLEENGIDPQRFEFNQRNNLRQSQLQRGVGATAFVTPADYRRYLNLYGELRRVAVATFEIERFAESVEVTDADVQQYYDERPSEFLLPETVDLEYIEIRRDQLAANADISEEELQKHYEASASRYLQDERRRASHILILTDDDEAAAAEQAKALAARAQAGEPFADLARQYSRDGGTSSQGGDLGVIVQSQFPGALGDAIFAMRKGEIRGPVKSEFGLHVVRLEEIIPGGPLPLNEVRGELERELRDARGDVAFREKERSISDALFDGADLGTMAQSAGLELQSASGFTRSGGDPFGNNQAAIDAVFDPRVLTEGGISDIIEIDANRSVVLRVVEHHEASRRPLDEMREQIVESVRLTRARTIIQDKVNSLQESLNAGESISEAAAAVDASFTPYSVIDRLNESVDGRVLEAIYRAKKPLAGKPRVGTAITDEGDYAVFTIDAVAPGRPESVPLADRDARKEQLSGQSGSADYTAFVLQLEREADIVRSESALAEQDNF
ncbi:MAG: SurA N-terminal domain-containing protein [Gammaproteobacteria bacterium]|nr:SurA N-terminal domain-containing protein [Gammaproteobacteria bacterium]MDH4316138.1 SurA N-terminal domain-containing protein [Gammaproteobacteria bacterium]MDH5214899.1 SurA N-terminal domain-containing protein [Gammaproteobacteria bacterium]